MQPSDAGYDAMAPAVDLTFFFKVTKSNVTNRLSHFGKRQIARVSKESGTKHFLCITKNAWIVAQFQCESTFIPHIADCDYAQRSLTTRVLLR